MKVDELRAELRSLRKGNMKPISKMPKDDISREIERLKGMREETPAVAAVPSAPPRKMKAAAENIKEAKREEFPVAPAAKKKEASPEKSKTKAKLLKMLAAMESSDEE
jgi:hypothetical protein